MTRKESEKEAERPHYYSQFWLDVAAGRRIIGTPKTNEDGDLEESEAPILTRPVRHSSPSDGYHETIAHPEVEPDFENDDDTYAEPELEETEPIVDEEAEEIEVPPVVVEEEEIPDVDFAPVDAEEEVEEEEEKEDEFFDEEEEEEEDDDLSWGGARGRKKPKPGRQAKLPPKPPVKKPTKRRGSF